MLSGDDREGRRRRHAQRDHAEPAASERVSPHSLPVLANGSRVHRGQHSRRLGEASTPGHTMHSSNLSAAVIGLIQDILTGCKILFFFSQISSAIRALAKEASCKDNPYIICGDFNSPPDSPGYELACDGKLSQDAIDTVRSIKLPQVSQLLLSVFIVLCH